MTQPIIPGAEPWSHNGGPNGALVLHGFTGNCKSMRGLAVALADAGFSVEMPLLPGHGTHIDDMIPTTFTDWATAAEAAYESLRSRCEHVVIAGLSMGGTLTAWLASRHPELAGAAFINAVIEPADPALRQIVTETLASGVPTIDAIGGDIADPEGDEASYPATPLAPLLSMMDAWDALQTELSKIACPVLILSAPQDHTVPPSNSDTLAAAVSGPVERVSLDRSYHVATVDYDRELVESSIVAFAQRVCV